MYTEEAVFSAVIQILGEMWLQINKKMNCSRDLFWFATFSNLKTAKINRRFEIITF